MLWPAEFHESVGIEYGQHNTRNKILKFKISHPGRLPADDSPTEKAVVG